MTRVDVFRLGESRDAGRAREASELWLINTARGTASTRGGLSPHGKAQARRVGRVAAQLEFEKVVATGSKLARETAALAFPARKIERDVSLEATINKGKPKKWLQALPSGKVAVVCDGPVLSTLLAHIIGCPKTVYSAAIFRIKVANGRVQTLLSWNDQRHLAGGPKVRELRDRVFSRLIDEFRSSFSGVQGQSVEIEEVGAFLDLIWPPCGNTPVVIERSMNDPAFEVSGYSRYVAFARVFGEIRFYASPIEPFTRDWYRTDKERTRAVDDEPDATEIGILRSVADAVAITESYIAGSSFGTIDVPRYAPSAGKPIESSET